MFDIDLILQNILNPPILFFLLGMLAVFLKSDLEIPQPIPKLFSILLLISIGLQGGYKLYHNGIDINAIKVLGAAILMSIVVPIYSFFILRLKLDVYNSAAIAATYGSISAVTFVAAGNFLHSLNESFGGYMIAAMALMESPAIVIGLILAYLFANNNTKNGTKESTDWKEVLREAFLNGSVLLLIGALVIGFITGEKGWDSMKPLYGDLFKPILAVFLLDMGLVAAKYIGSIKKVGKFLVSFGILVPIFNAFISIIFAKFMGFDKGDAFMFSVLCASASYIAVPAAMRLSLPESNPSLYVSMALAITFPFNIVIGLPIYYNIVNLLWN